MRMFKLPKFVEAAPPMSGWGCEVMTASSGQTDQCPAYWDIEPGHRRCRHLFGLSLAECRHSVVPHHHHHHHH